MVLLSDLTRPGELVNLSEADLDDLAEQIRQFLIEKVSATGGHLGPNLGVVELTLAVHRVFHSPEDPVLFDTGHISYVHKMLTGRQAGFDTLRQPGGLSGYPSRAESEHDWLEHSHASSALSWATGVAEAFRLSGNPHHVVVVVGDGALTGGMAWEALNNIAVQKDLRMVIIVNDNGRSYTPTVGGLAAQLSGIRTDRRYDPTLDIVKAVVQNTPLVGRGAYDLLHGLKAGLKDILAPQGLFSDLGLKYIGPVAGHDRAAVEKALAQAKGYEGPVIVHCLTQKGHGFTAAEQDDEDHFHAVGQFDPITGKALGKVEGATWTGVFAHEILQLATQDDRLVAISAAMVNPVGLGPMAKRWPERVFDVGIAEQHAVASAAGMAIAGLHPVVAVYATFLNRGFDQVLMDVGLHRLPVTFVLDRAGITGPDGPSHHGVWDLAVFSCVPGIRVAAPRDEQRLRTTLAEATADLDHPTVVRFPKGALPASLPARSRRDGLDLLVEADDARVTVIGYGPMAQVAHDAAVELNRRGVPTQAVDPVWVWPISDALIDLARQSSIVVSVEDGIEVGGLGQKLQARLGDVGSDAAMIRCGVPDAFVPQGSRTAILAQLGLTSEAIVEKVLAADTEPR
ncbi:MAG: 1-deoxy-D-xylulose-5-phosphate synthase [Propionibacteriaceae bacterium]|jgi:1-deoxy-D-xylulose-5-phosphate synthase|nr:1-deoxy-D-xylulose-5-phosphate synthase [Propionibacteriaceae bacterium]